MLKSMRQNQLLTLLSDFGNSDVYVGAIKGVIAQINPELNIIDLTHQVPPQDIAAGRFCLLNAYPFFPDGTVHVAVVDPGVGGVRRAIAVEFAHGFLVGPDNGLLSGVLSQSPPLTAVELNNQDYWRTTQLSKTFHGRDIFAPVGAHLASGVPIHKLGTEINPADLVKLDIAQCTYKPDSAAGCIQYIDRFGNLVTNIPGSYVEDKAWYVKALGMDIPGCETYSDVQVGEALAVVGSHGWVEIAINAGSAHLQLHMDLRDAVQVMVSD